jgi:hypothetical protein
MAPLVVSQSQARMLFASHHDQMGLIAMCSNAEGLKNKILFSFF